jgi:rhamnose utilization protein RhaD (predicted bifunctional aldolase and dehydrogenase)
MTHTTWEPGLVSPALVTLTTLLGEPAHDLAILAEGNTSELLEDGRLVVKASGAGLAVATAEDFVVVDMDEVMAVVDDPDTTQADLSAVLVASGTDRPDGAGPRRGSIETVVHAAVHTVARDAGIVGVARFIGHTHPTDVVGLLASVRAQEAWTRIVYSDEAVVIGRPLFVPYATPGLALGRIYAVALREYVETHAALPQLVLLANHGIVAIAPTAAGVEAVSTMAVKGARVRATAYAVGGVAPLSDADVEKFFARDDITERRANLARGR